MYLINPNPTFEMEVPLHVAGQDAQTIKLTFKYFDADQLRKWRESRSSLLDALFEVISGWSGVDMPGGDPAPYSKENLRTLLNSYPAAGENITQEYLRESLGARRKN